MSWMQSPGSEERQREELTLPCRLRFIFERVACNAAHPSTLSELSISKASSSWVKCVRFTLLGNARKRSAWCSSTSESDRDRRAAKVFVEAETLKDGLRAVWGLRTSAEGRCDRHGSSMTAPFLRLCTADSCAIRNLSTEEKYFLLY